MSNEGINIKNLALKFQSKAGFEKYLKLLINQLDPEEKRLFIGIASNTRNELIVQLLDPNQTKQAIFQKILKEETDPDLRRLAEEGMLEII